MSQNSKPANERPSSSLAIAAIQATIKQLLSEGRVVKIEHSDVDGLVIRTPCASLDVVKVDGKRRIVDASTTVMQEEAAVPCSLPQ